MVYLYGLYGLYGDDDEVTFQRRAGFYWQHQDYHSSLAFPRNPGAAS